MSDVLGIDSDDSSDVVLRALDESTLGYEDSANELWRTTRASFAPRRWTLTANQQFVVVPPLLPTSWVTPDTYVRVHYIKKATPVVLPADPIDISIPDYYQEAIRYAAAAYLMEKDTDLKSMQLKKEMMESFEYHMSGGVPPLAVTDQDS
jgi:hypothetical protein